MDDRVQSHRVALPYCGGSASGWGTVPSVGGIVRKDTPRSRPGQFGLVNIFGVP
jgi:hypothetical protein